MTQQVKLCQHIKTLNKQTIKQILTKQLTINCQYHINHPLYYICLFCGNSLCISFHNQGTCLDNHYCGQKLHIFYLEVDNGSIWCVKCEDTIQNQIFQYDGEEKNDVFLKLVRFQAYIKDIWNQIKHKCNLKQSSIVHRGLKNLGNTCYLNSVLQCFYASNALKQLYSSYQIKEDHISINRKIIAKELQYFFDEMIEKRQSYIWNVVAIKKREKGQNRREDRNRYIINAIKRPSLNIQLRHFFDEMKKGDGSSFIPRNILKLLGDLNSKYLIRQQQDADELLLLMLDALNQGQRLSFLKDRQRYTKIQSILGNYKLSPIQNLFGFFLINQIQCNQCKQLTISSNLAYNISLSLNNNNLPKQSTKIIHKSQKLQFQYLQELYYPKEETEETNNTFLSQFFEVERLNKSNNYYQCLKCKSILAYRKYYMLNQPQILIVTLKRFNSSLQKKNMFKQFPQSINLNGIIINDKKCVYDLYGVIIHQGKSLTTGHYLCVVKIDGKWLLCSDQKIQIVNWEYVKSREAYILFYEKNKNLSQE